MRRFLGLAAAVLLLAGSGMSVPPARASAARRDHKAPTFRWLGIRPEPLTRGRSVHLTYRATDESRKLEASYSITDSDGDLITRVRNRIREPGRGSFRWHARYGNGSTVVPGLYRATITLEDRAGNSTTGPSRPFRVLRRTHTKVFRRIDGAGRRVALTFDDCNDPRSWSHMLRVLASRHVRASFFCLGIKVAQYPELARRTVAHGHTIGSHGWDHANPTSLSYSGVRSRLVKDKRVWWSKARDTPAPYFRPPYGSYNGTTLRAAGSAGYARTILWDVDPSDYTRPGASVIAHRVVSAARPGSIVIMHNQLQTAQALPAIIRGLRHHHLMPVTLAELCRAGGLR